MAFRATPVLRSSFRKWCYNISGFNRYGLYRDDCLNDEDPDVLEAIKRLPSHVVDERQFRQVRAINLSGQKKLMPKDQWTKYEEDILYLTPIVEEVKKEREEKERWIDDH